MRHILEYKKWPCPREIPKIGRYYGEKVPRCGKAGATQENITFQKVIVLLNIFQSTQKSRPLPALLPERSRRWNWKSRTGTCSDDRMARLSHRKEDAELKDNAWR